MRNGSYTASDKYLQPCLRCRCGFKSVMPMKQTALPAMSPKVTQYTIQPAFVVDTNPVLGACAMFFALQSYAYSSPAMPQTSADR